MPAQRRRSAVTTVTTVTPQSRELYRKRLKLQDEVKREEYQFTRRPTHLRAAKLAALRTLVSEIEMEIVGLDLCYQEGEGDD